MFDEVLSKVKEWFSSIEKLYQAEFATAVERDDSTAFIVNIDSDIFISRVSVLEPEWRPFRFVEFMILDLRLESDQEPVFCYGDQDEDSIDDIIGNLNRGIQFMLAK